MHSGLEELERHVALYCFIYVDNNQITEKGCSYISKAEWKKLEILNLGKYFLTKAAIKSVIRAAHKYAREIGRN